MTEITLIRNVLNQKIGKSNHYWKIITILQKNIVLFGRKSYLFTPMYLIYVHTWDKLLLLNNEFTDVKPSKKTCHYDIHNSSH